MASGGFDTRRLITEVGKREGLYRRDMEIDQSERLNLWREVGQAMYKDWNQIGKAEVYDRVIELQRKWRSLRDAYRRECRFKKLGERCRRQYVHYKSLKRLFDPDQEDDDDDNDDNENNEENSVSHSANSTSQIDDTSTYEVPEQNVKDENDYSEEIAVEVDPLLHERKSIRKKRMRELRTQRHSRRVKESIIAQLQNKSTRERSPIVQKLEDDTDSDKLFLLSFASELRRLQPSVRMWARAQIANVMQEAVAMQCSPASTSTTADAASVRTKIEMEATRVESYGSLL